MKYAGSYLGRYVYDPKCISKYIMAKQRSSEETGSLPICLPLLLKHSTGARFAYTANIFRGLQGFTGKVCNLFS